MRRPHHESPCKAVLPTATELSIELVVILPPPSYSLCFVCVSKNIMTLSHCMLTTLVLWEISLLILPFLVISQVPDT